MVLESPASQLSSPQCSCGAQTALNPAGPAGRLPQRTFRMVLCCGVPGMLSGTDHLLDYKTSVDTLETTEIRQTESFASTVEGNQKSVDIRTSAHKEMRLGSEWARGKLGAESSWR